MLLDGKDRKIGMQMGEIERGSLGTACWGCGASVPRENNYCGKCGKGQGRFVHWYYRHVGAILISLVAGPFSLYFIWRSPVLPQGAKWGYTTVVLALTWYVVSAVLGFLALVRDMASSLQF